jgi:hypothetical protein
MDNSESGDEVAAFMHSAEGTYITADGKKLISHQIHNKINYFVQLKSA